MDSRIKKKQAQRKTNKVGRPRVYIPLNILRDFRAQGLSFRSIAAAMDVGYGSVRRAWNKQVNGEVNSNNTEPSSMKDGSV